MAAFEAGVPIDGDRIAFLPVPAVNLVYHDATHPSSPVLPVVNGVAVGSAGLPECGTIIRQPCRPA